MMYSHHGGFIHFNYSLKTTIHYDLLIYFKRYYYKFTITLLP